MRSERNEKLLKVIDEAIATTSSFDEALDKILKYKKENEELIGINFFILPVSEDGTVDKEKVAEELITMMRASAKGEYKDITHLDI